jgi:hypothetical protein
MIFFRIIVLLLGVGLNIAGSCILAKAIIKSIDEIKNISNQYWGFNPYLLKALKTDRKSGILGLSLLIPGITLQLIYAIIEISINIS